MKFLIGLAAGVLLMLIAGVGIYYGWTRYSISSIQLSGNIVSEERNVSGFNKIKVSGAGLLNIVQGDEENLTVTADEKVLKHVVSKVSNGKLHLYLDTPSRVSFLNFSSDDIVFDVRLKNIEKVEIEGSGKMDSERLSADKVEFSISGSGEINTGLDVNHLIATINGSGSYNLTGIAKNQEVKISGSGKFDGSELFGKNGDIDISGSGKTVVNVSDKLKLKISGSGEVGYYGDPSINQSISGSGKVEQLGKASSTPAIDTSSDINSFDDCIAAGNPAMESYPRKCSADGKTFTEDISDKLTLEEARRIASFTKECSMTGLLSDTYIYNENTDTWWFDIERLPELEKDGCKPACVVDEEGGKAEVNMRCTGANPSL